MIIEAIFSVFLTGVRVVLQGVWMLIPAPPGWYLTAAGNAGWVVDYIEAFNTWIPVTLAATVAGAVVLTYVIGYTIGIIRVIVSYLTFGGGAT